MKAAFKIAFPVANCAAVDESRSLVAAEMKNGEIVVELSCELPSNAARRLGFNISGNVEIVGDEMKVEVLLVEFEIM